MNKNYCLCYTLETGLFVQVLPKGTTDETVLFCSFDKNGSSKTIVKVPNENFVITINSHFGYGHNSYLYATISTNDTNLLDFDSNKLRYLNNADINYFVAKPNDWLALFEKIEYAYNLKQSIGNSSEYLLKLDALLESNEIVFYEGYDSFNTVVWNDSFVKLLFVARKLKNLLEQFLISDAKPNMVIEETMKLCLNFLEHIKKLTLDTNDNNRNSQISDTLYVVHCFMVKQHKGLKFLYSFIS